MDPFSPISRYYSFPFRTRLRIADVFLFDVVVLPEAWPQLSSLRFRLTRNHKSKVCKLITPPDVCVFVLFVARGEHYGAIVIPYLQVTSVCRSILW